MNKIDKAIDFLVEEDPLFSNPILFNDKWLDDHVEGVWTRRPDEKIDVVGNISLINMGLEQIPLNFGKVRGNFDCSSNELSDLQGAPEWVGGWFDCGGNNIISLTGAPKFVREYFICTNNQLTSLVGGPEEIGDSYFCKINPITSLEGAPKKVLGLFHSDEFSDSDYRDYAKERDG